ncbi:MAG: hypothetical protein Q4A32_07110 [Lachnospiraceae bacterium]|nr:hypothetical protein [Lachnospiraceae bacterium]
MVLLPVLAGFLLYIIFSALYKRQGQKDSYFCIILTVTTTVLYVFVTVELFSVLHILAFAPILGAWILFLGVELAGICYILKKPGWKREELLEAFGFPKVGSPHSDRDTDTEQTKKRFSIGNLFLVPLYLIIAAVCLAAVAFALHGVPNNYDGMSYHLPRIVHWLQNRSVAHYACHDISQISDPYLAEFVNLHFYVLSGNSDRFLNLLQTFSYVLTVLFVHRIAVKLGCGKLWSLFAAMVYAMSPIVFGEALNVQTDIFAGLWLIFFAYLTLWFIDKERIPQNGETAFRIILMGLVCGFAYAAKASVLFGIVAFAGWLVICCLLRKDDIKQIILCGVGVMIPAGLIVLPEFAKNMITFGSFAADESSTHFLIPVFSPRYFIYNFVVNVAYNLPNSFLDIRRPLTRILKAMRYILFSSVDVPPGLRNFSFLKNLNIMNHDTALNTVVMWLFVLALFLAALSLIYCVTQKRKNPLFEKGVGMYWIPSLTAFSIFLGIVGWYRYITRYEASYFPMVLPGIAYIMSRVFAGKKTRFIGYAVIAASACMLFYQGALMYRYQMNHIRQGKTRIEEYFRYRDMHEDYGLMTDYIREKGFTQLGFMCGDSSYEYPFWVMTEKPGRRVEHVNVTNETARYADPDFIPECIFTTDTEHFREVSCNGKEYVLLYETEDAVLYVPEESASR